MHLQWNFLGEKKELKNINDKHILNIDSSFQKSINIIKSFIKIKNDHYKNSVQN